MLFPAPDIDQLYEALLARDTAYDGRWFVGVSSTGIFCRLTCPARKPKREHCHFFDTVAACLEAGFRPCKRCHPLAAKPADDPAVKTLLTALEARPVHRWSEADLINLGFDPSTVRRAFKRHFGLTFLDLARLTRLRNGAEVIASGGSVIEAQLEAGFDSASGFRTAFTRLLGQSPSVSTGDTLLRADWIATPIGPMIVIADRHALHLLEFHDRKALPQELRTLRQQTGSNIGLGRFEPTEQIEAELNAYFNGTCMTFGVSLAMGGTPFNRRVWTALQAILAGETRSYGALAETIGQPSAVRAVARANGANRIGLVVPCHRVIGADGSLTGYGGGLWRKRWLIDHERKHTGKISRQEDLTS